MTVAVDCGNSFIKAGLFEEEVLVKQFTFDSEQTAKEWIETHSDHSFIVASVSTAYETISERINFPQHTLFLDHDTYVPFINSYQSKATLGIDRIALASGASTRFPQQDVLVIDMGTCITFDFINKESRYLGGAISPGLQMRFKSLHNFTARLPLINTEPDVPLIGVDTKSSILSGVVQGITAEVEGIIAKYKQTYPHMVVIISGGDAKYFESRIKEHIFAIPELVLVGLNAILRHNASI